MPPLRGRSEVPERALERRAKSAGSGCRAQARHTNAGIFSARQPSMSSLLPFQFDVMKTTSARQSRYALRTSFIRSGRPPARARAASASEANAKEPHAPRALESHSIMRSGGMLRRTRSAIAGPNVRSWSEPTQMRNQSGDCRHVESAAPTPVPVQTRTPRR
jgi:hypothetical protein